MLAAIKVYRQILRGGFKPSSEICSRLFSLLVSGGRIRLLSSSPGNYSPGRRSGKSRCRPRRSYGCSCRYSYRYSYRYSFLLKDSSGSFPRDRWEGRMRPVPGLLWPLPKAVSPV